MPSAEDIQAIRAVKDEELPWLPPPPDTDQGNRFLNKAKENPFVPIGEDSVYSLDSLSLCTLTQVLKFSGHFYKSLRCLVSCPASLSRHETVRCMRGHTCHRNGGVVLIYFVPKLLPVRSIL